MLLNNSQPAPQPEIRLLSQGPAPISLSLIVNCDTIAYDAR